MASESSSDDEYSRESPHRRLRIKEIVSRKVARMLDTYSGTIDFLQARSIDVTNETVNALENEILPELHKLEAMERSGEPSIPHAASEQDLLILMSSKREEAEAMLEKTRILLGEETTKRRDALARAFHAFQDKTQEQNEKERYQNLWLCAEKRALVAEDRVASFLLERLTVQRRQNIA